MPVRFRSIATLLIQRIVALAMVCLLGLASLHVWLEFQHEQKRFENVIRVLSEASGRTLGNVLWDIDSQAVRQQLQWMAELPELAHVQVKVRTTGETFRAGLAEPAEPPVLTLQIMPPDGQQMALGELMLWKNEAYFHNLMISSTLRVLLGYIVFTGLICLMVAWVMRRELRQPLSHIARFAASLKPNELARPLEIARPHRDKTDEIDLVIQGFQQLQEDLRRYIDNLDQLVADRTQKLEVMVEEVKRLSLQDALTGCLNRRALDERLPGELERSQRYGRPLSVVFTDIDRFKAINDQLGHGVGDSVLREVAQRLQADLRSQVDWVARYGGEEFLIVMPETTAEEAAELAHRLGAHIRSAPVQLQGREVPVTVSFGVAQLRKHESLQTLLERADGMLYQAKADGRDCVRVAQ